jgi:sRNA-binding carbon storage regulator CsrA
MLVLSRRKTNNDQAEFSIDALKDLAIVRDKLFWF